MNSGTVTPDSFPSSILNTPTDFRSGSSDVESECDEKPALFKLMPIQRRSLTERSFTKKYDSDGDETAYVAPHSVSPNLEALKVASSSAIVKVKPRQVFRYV
jgi:hypothetical protein